MYSWKKDTTTDGNEYIVIDANTDASTCIEYYITPIRTTLSGEKSGDKYVCCLVEDIREFSVLLEELGILNKICSFGSILDFVKWLFSLDLFNPLSEDYRVFDAITSMLDKLSSMYGETIMRYHSALLNFRKDFYSYKGLILDDRIYLSLAEKYELRSIYMLIVGNREKIEKHIRGGIKILMKNLRAYGLDIF